ncbi:NAD-dependent epimerase/dehydratase family protein [Thiohalophilus sp.]|uniref:NAD-dependent epimerase/dehydratase family protein n=1 Tax=Thiohalophilus sp. TaxID=3028392 RepID=UPI003975600D
MDKQSKIVIPGAAGLVGQNLIVFLTQAGYTNLVGIDKHPHNTRMLAELHPDITVVEADLAESGPWQQHFEGAEVVIMLQAQIGALTEEPFIRNNIHSTRHVIDACKRYSVPYIVHISSSVVESVASDFYTNSKKAQEQLVEECGIPHIILRPTLMFGWFDRKHLGWLSRFMKKSPIFPIPSHGRFMRQPLYVKDFCNIIISAMQQRRHNEIFNITGREKVDYVDIIRTIKQVQGLRTWIVHIPYRLFWFLLWFYALFDRDPPFTTQQLGALVAHDEFELIPWWENFGVSATPFEAAIRETYTDPTYSAYILDF